MMMPTHHHQHMSDPQTNAPSRPQVSIQDKQPPEIEGATAGGKFPAGNVAKSYPPVGAKYEEVARSPELFLETLVAFHQSMGTRFTIPTVGGKALDLHRLFVEVTYRGGLEKVIRERNWREVIATLKLPTTITNASFILRKYYSSLLYHFEQACYFCKPDNSAQEPDPVLRSPDNGSGPPVQVASMNHVEDEECATLQPGSLVIGSIVGKCETGYMVSVNLGSTQLEGMLFHVPAKGSQTTPVGRPRKSRRRSKLALRDPFRPKSNRSGYNFFFAEHYARLKPSYRGHERAISKKIGYLWNNLTEAEKQVYQEKGVRDKERYRAELLEYKSSLGTRPQQPSE